MPNMHAYVCRGCITGGTRVPLMARYPPSIKAGTTYNVPVNNIDLAPTIMDALGVLGTTSLDFDGLSWWKGITGNNDPALLNRQCIVSEIYQKRAVVCGRYKLFSNDDTVFDPTKDPLRLYVGSCMLR